MNRVAWASGAGLKEGAYILHKQQSGHGKSSGGEIEDRWGFLLLGMIYFTYILLENAGMTGGNAW